MPSQEGDRPVLTTAGRRDLQQRLDRSLEALAGLAERMSSGERTADELAEYHLLLEQVEDTTAVLARAADVATVDEDPTTVELGDEVDVEIEDGEVDTYALVDPVEA